MFITLQSFFLGRLRHNRLDSSLYFLSQELSNKRLQTVNSFLIEQRLNAADLALKGLLLSGCVEFSCAVEAKVVCAF